jgi:hypothetical protein
MPKPVRVCQPQGIGIATVVADKSNLKEAGCWDPMAVEELQQVWHWLKLADAALQNADAAEDPNEQHTSEPPVLPGAKRVRP